MASMKEKAEKIEQIERVDLVDVENVIGVAGDDETIGVVDASLLDPAAIFLAKHIDVDSSHIDIAKLRHKVDRNIVPLLALCFYMQFLDKAVYNYTGTQKQNMAQVGSVGSINPRQTL
jgi:hypothetical protein